MNENIKAIIIDTEPNYNNYIQILQPTYISYDFIKQIPIENEICFKVVLDLDGKPQNNYFGRYAEHEWTRFMTGIKNNNGKLTEPILLRLDDCLTIEDGAHRLYALQFLIKNNLISEENLSIPVIFKVSPNYSFNDLNIMFNRMLDLKQIDKNDYVQLLNQLVLLRIEHEEYSLKEETKRQGLRSPGMVWKTVHHNWRAWNKRIPDPNLAIRGFGAELDDYERAKLWALGNKEVKKEDPIKKIKKQKNTQQPKSRMTFADLATSERKKELARTKLSTGSYTTDFVEKEFNKIWIVKDIENLNPVFDKEYDAADAYLVRDKKYILKSKLKELGLLENNKFKNNKFLCEKFSSEEIKFKWSIDSANGKIISDKDMKSFKNTSPEFSIFNSGLEAIKQMIQKLPSEMMRMTGLLHGNFIETNAVYAKDINYIELQNIVTSDGAEFKNSKKILDKLVEIVPIISSTSPSIEYEGEALRDIKRVISDKTINWQFKAGEELKAKNQYDKQQNMQIEGLADNIQVHINELYQIISNELGLKPKEISEKQWNRFDSAEEFLNVRSSKFKSTRKRTGQDQNANFDKKIILDKIELVMDELQNVGSIFKDELVLLKQIKLSAHKLLVLKKKVEDSKTFIDLVYIFVALLDLSE